MANYSNWASRSARRRLRNTCPAAANHGHRPGARSSKTIFGNLSRWTSSSCWRMIDPVLCIQTLQPIRRRSGRRSRFERRFLGRRLAGFCCAIGTGSSGPKHDIGITDVRGTFRRQRRDRKRFDRAGFLPSRIENEVDVRVLLDDGVGHVSADEEHLRRLQHRERGQKPVEHAAVAIDWYDRRGQRTPRALAGTEDHYSMCGHGRSWGSKPSAERAEGPAGVVVNGG